jgi:meso-butanediol dehydrogenase / (S,S)-butanediol dehydrogenase / diacetyl reductase
MTIAAGRVALVTGGAAGLGLAITRRLVAGGVRVVIVDVATDELDAAQAESGAAVVSVEADVRSRDALTAAVATAIERFGGLDTVVLAAGVIRGAPILECTEADWDMTLDVNLKGAFLAIQAAGPFLRASGRARVVAISSDAGRRGFAGAPAYCASKFGLIGLIESLAAEISEWGGTANCVCPIGIPTTAMGRSILARQANELGMAADEILAARARGIPLGRNATEADVAHAVEFLISEEASFLTGLSIDVDGGTHLGRNVLIPWR